MIPRLSRVPLALASTGLLLAGCAGTVESTRFIQFGEGVAIVDRQSQTALAESNKLARDVSVERFIRSGAIGLAENSFTVAVDPKDIAAWQSAFDGIERYAALIASLSDAKRHTDAGDAVTALGAQLNGLGAGISPEVATGFASLAGLIVQQKAQRDAVQIIRATDPAIQTILTQMATALGTDDGSGLRGTVAANWTDSLRGVREAYVDAAQAKDAAQQRALIDEYLATLDRRDAQLQALAGLRSSLLSLAQAHAAEAAEAPASASRLLALIARQADENERLFDAVKSAQEEGGQ